MYFTFSIGGNEFESLINFGFSLVPTLHSSISYFRGSNFGFLGTSFESNKSSKGVNLLGKKLSLRLMTSVSSSIISSISISFRLSTSDFVNLGGWNLSISSLSISLISILFLKFRSIVMSIFILLFTNSSSKVKNFFICFSLANTC